MEKKYLITNLNPRTRKLETFDYRTGELVGTEEGIRNNFIYSYELGQAICNLVREGNTLKKIADMADMPMLATLYRWRNMHPDFKENLKQSKKDRAEFYHDMAVQELEDAEGITKDDVAAAKMRLDGYIKLAEKGNPEEFNPKPNILQNAKAPTMIVINTGISREPTHIEVNDEKICIGGRPEERLRGTHEESGSIETTATIAESRDTSNPREQRGDIEGTGEFTDSEGPRETLCEEESETKDKEESIQEIGGTDANKTRENTGKD